MTAARIASSGVQHETNTFVALPTTLADFARDSDADAEFTGGSVIMDRFRSTGTIHAKTSSSPKSACYAVGISSIRVDLRP